MGSNCSEIKGTCTVVPCYTLIELVVIIRFTEGTVETLTFIVGWILFVIHSLIFFSRYYLVDWYRCFSIPFIFSNIVSFPHETKGFSHLTFMPFLDILTLLLALFGVFFLRAIMGEENNGAGESHFILDHFVIRLRISTREVRNFTNDIDSNNDHNN